MDMMQCVAQRSKRKYIDADRLKKAVEHELDMQDLYLPVHFFEVVDGMEAADVQEVKHGRWKETTTEDPCYYRCSECGRQTDDEYNYCPNCGSRMDLDGDTE